MAKVHPQAKTLIAGLGQTGLSAARYLVRQGRVVRVVDTRETPPGLAALRAQLPSVDFRRWSAAGADLLDGVDELIVSPGLTLSLDLVQQAVARGIDVRGDIDLFADAVQAPIVAVTGSNGKSTVTTLVGEMMSRAGRRALIGGNIGTPALDLLAEPVPDFYVLEISSFQLERTAALGAAAAAVLNVSPDHMDRYRSIEEYAAAKARIFLAPRGGRSGVAVLNADDGRVAAMAPAGHDAIRFGLGEPGPGDFGLLRRSGQIWLAHGDRALLAADRVALVGRHNLANVLAAMALGAAVGLPEAAMIAAATEFQGLAHRMQIVAEVGGVLYCNDSKGTNVGATVAALAGVERPVVLIAGGDGKGADFSPLRPWIAGRATAVVLIGRDAPALGAALKGATDLYHATDMREAVRIASALADPGQMVLLSPACASLDMFDDYRHRGEVFAQAVAELAVQS